MARDKVKRRRRAMAIWEGCILLRNDTEHGSSNYRPDRFRLTGRYNRTPNAYVQQETTPMLYIAVQWRSGTTLAGMASFLEHASSPPDLLTGTTKEEIQSKIRARLSQYPNEQWIICSGNTIGERADPPVRFRSL